MKLNLFKPNLLSLFVCLFVFWEIQAQDLTPTNADLLKHDLFWIKPANDFDQTPLSAAQIDAEIAYRIQEAISNQALTRDIEIPINLKKIKYLGFVHPNDLGLFNAFPVTMANSSSINKKLYIYKYDNFYVSVEQDDATNQQHVYFTLRALEILKNRYRKAFVSLFLDTQAFPTNQPKFENFSNSNKAFWIAFNNTPLYIAKSYTSFLKDGVFPNTGGTQIERYRNIPVIDIHAQNILGNIDTKGSKVIYQKNTAYANYLLYMREGLIETLIHEMLHVYMDYAYTSNPTIATIRRARSLSNFKYAEECAVMNTSLSYFINQGGLSDELFQYYYMNVFNSNINALRNNKQYNNYGSLVSGKTKINNLSPREVFRLDVLD